MLSPESPWAFTAALRVFFAAYFGAIFRPLFVPCETSAFSLLSPLRLQPAPLYSFSAWASPALPALSGPLPIVPVVQPRSWLWPMRSFFGASERPVPCHLLKLVDDLNVADQTLIESRR
jgi:hypothetical protein